MNVNLLILLAAIALAPWLLLAALLTYRRLVNRRKKGTADRLQEELLKALQDVDGPAQIGYLEIRRIDPDSLFSRSPGRLS